MTGAAASLLVFSAALPYPGVTVDSGEYLAVADSLTDGHGFTLPFVGYDEPFTVLDPGERVPMAQFPPLYPGLLALVHGVTSLSLLAAARLTGSVIFGASVALGSFLVWRQSRRVLLAALSAGLLVAPELLTAHAMVWSEPLMILALLGALHFSVVHLQSGRRGPLLAAGVCAALASLVRFAGLAVILGIALAMMASGSAPRAIRLRRAVIFSALSLLPALAWFVRNAVVVGVPTEKTLDWHLPGIRHLDPAFVTIGKWLIPYAPVARWCGLVLVLASLVFAAIVLRRRIRPDARTVHGACVVFGLTYLVFVLLSRTLIDLNIPLDARILAPPQVLGVIALCSAAGTRARLPGSSLIIALIGLLSISAIVRGVVTAHDFTSLPVTGYTNEEWRASETLEFAGSLPPAVPIITNAPDPIWLWHRPPPLLIPPRSNLYNGRPNLQFEEQLNQLHEATGCLDAIVVFFDRPTRKHERVIDPVVVQELDLRRLARFADGEAWTVGSPPGGC
jgi:hypothetical protein